MDKVEIGVVVQTNSGVLYPGQPIRGEVQIQLKAPAVQTHSLQVEINGEAKTAWVSKASDKIYETSQPYIAEVLKLPVGNRDPNGSYFLTGDVIHTVPFSSKLPANLPPSFEGEYGYIRYVISAKLAVVENSQLAEVKCQRLLTVVVGPQNSAFFDGLKTPVQREETLDIIGCCRSGFVLIHFKVPKISYYAGEMVNAIVQFRNQSGKKISKANMALMQESRFQAQSRYESATDYKDMKRFIDSVQLDKSVEANSEYEWIANLSVGIMPPTCSSQLIDIQHSLKLSVETVELSIPINLAFPALEHQ